MSLLVRAALAAGVAAGAGGAGVYLARAKPKPSPERPWAPRPWVDAPAPSAPTPANPGSGESPPAETPRAPAVGDVVRLAPELAAVLLAWPVPPTLAGTGPVLDIMQDAEVTDYPVRAANLGHPMVWPMARVRIEGPPARAPRPKQWAVPVRVLDGRHAGLAGYVPLECVPKDVPARGDAAGVPLAARRAAYRDHHAAARAALAAAAAADPGGAAEHSAGYAEDVFLRHLGGLRERQGPDRLTVRQMAAVVLEGYREGWPTGD